jgi:hypothetical protein
MYKEMEMLKEEMMADFEEASNLFIKLDLIKQAAQVFFSMDQYEKAAECFIKIEYYNQAGIF